MPYFFEGHCLDPVRRELHRGSTVVAVEPQVFDLLEYLILHRERVVSRDELFDSVWCGRVVSESTLASRIFAARQAVGDSGKDQRVIRTLARKGLRFVAQVRDGPATEDAVSDGADASQPPRRCQVSVLVCRFVGAATLAGRVDPEEIAESMAHGRARAERVVHAWGGAGTALAPDAYVAWFGLPRAREDDAERAAHAAIEIAGSASEASAASPGAALRSRIGIATGLVVSAPGPAPAAPLVGRAPLLAMRLAAVGAGRDVLVCPQTRRLLGRLFVCRDLGPIAVDEGETVEGASIVGENAALSRFEALRASGTTTIGRDDEIALLQRRWAQVACGEGRVVLIGGEPGIGKSHLVAALLAQLQVAAHPVWRLSCSPQRAHTALYPLVTHLERAAGFASGDDDAARIAKLQRLLAPISDRVDQDAELFAQLLSLPVGLGGALPPLSAQRRKEMVVERFLACLEAACAASPMLVVVEDAHWIDPTTLELLDALIDHVRSRAVLVLVTFRPEFGGSWLDRPQVSLLTLNRLGLRDSAALVAHAAGDVGLPPDMVERIVERSDGVPLFVEELTQATLEAAALEPTACASGGPAHDGLAVPPTLQASLAARLERFGPARQLAQTGAAIGREFGYELLRAVTDLDDTTLAQQLDALVASGLVHRRGVEPHARYTFKHALVQDAAHASMLRSPRAATHRRIANVLERSFPEAAEHHPDVLAMHCTEAGLWDRAIGCRIRASRLALERCAGVEAQAQVEQGLALLQHIGAGRARSVLEGRLHVALGDALAMTRGFSAPEVQAALTRARELLDDSAHSVEALRALCGLFNYHLIRSESPLCLALAEPYLERADAPWAASVGHYLVGAARLHLGDFTGTITHLEAALARYDEARDAPVAFVAGYHLRSFTLVWLALAYLYVGELRRAEQTIAAALDDARRRAHPFTLVSALLALARFRSHLRDLPAAVAATEEGLAVAAEQRSPYHLSRGRILRAINAIDAGRGPEAIAGLERAIDEHRATGANFLAAYNLTRLAEAFMQAGAIDQALAHSQDALADIECRGERWWLAEALRLRAAILRRGADTAGATSCLRRALDCATAQRASFWQLHAATDLAELLAAARRDDEARRTLAPVCRAFDDSPDFPALDAARRLLERLQPPLAPSA